MSGVLTSHKVGKEEGIARFLIHMIHNGFLPSVTADSEDEAPNKASEATSGIAPGAPPEAPQG